MLLSNPVETVSYLRLSSWFYSLIWNYRYSHVVSLVFTIVEAKCGIVSPESTAFSEDNNSDGEIEDVVETIPEPSPGVRPLILPSHRLNLFHNLSSLSRALVSLGQVVLFVTLFPSTFHMPFMSCPLIWHKVSYHRNGSFQSHDTKWCDNKSNICACFRFINAGILSMPLWKHKHLQSN